MKQKVDSIEERDDYDAVGLTKYLRAHGAEVTAVGIAGEELIVYTPKTRTANLVMMRTSYCWNNRPVSVKRMGKVRAI